MEDVDPEDLRTLRLIRAFSRITDPAVRREILEFAEARVPKSRERTYAPDDEAF